MSVEISWSISMKEWCRWGAANLRMSDNQSDMHPTELLGSAAYDMYWSSSKRYPQYNALITTHYIALRGNKENYPFIFLFTSSYLEVSHTVKEMSLHLDKMCMWGYVLCANVCGDMCFVQMYVGICALCKCQSAYASAQSCKSSILCFLQCQGSVDAWHRQWRLWSDW